MCWRELRLGVSRLWFSLLLGTCLSLILGFPNWFCFVRWTWIWWNRWSLRAITTLMLIPLFPLIVWWIWRWRRTPLSSIFGDLTFCSLIFVFMLFLMMRRLWFTLIIRRRTTFRWIRSLSSSLWFMLSSFRANLVSLLRRNFDSFLFFVWSFSVIFRVLWTFFIGWR